MIQSDIYINSICSWKVPVTLILIYPAEYKNNSFMDLIIEDIIEWFCQTYRVFNTPIITNGKRQANIIAERTRINEALT